MKLFASLLIFAAVFGHITTVPAVQERDLADKIRDIITTILAYIPESVGVKDVHLKIPANILINGEFNITEISLSGVKNLDIDTLTYDSNRLDYTFDFEDISFVLETHLVFTGPIALDHPLSIHVDLKDLKTEGYAVIAEDEKSVEDFSILVTLGESDFDIKGLLNNDELSENVSKFLTEHVAEVNDAIAKFLSPVASEVIKTIINIVLKIVN